MWGPCSEAAMKELSSRCHFVTDLMLDRLGADFDNDLLRRAFQCFSITCLKKAGLAAANPTWNMCQAGLREIAKAACVDPQLAAEEYKELVPIVIAERERLCSERKAGLTAELAAIFEEDKIDNREV